MKQVKLTSLLDLPPDAATLQREWTGHGRQGRRGLLLEFALFAGTIGPGLYMVSCFHRYGPGMAAGFLIVLLGYAIPHVGFLGRMARSWRSVFRPQTSWIGRGSIFAGLFMAAAFLSVAHRLPGLSVGPLRPDSGAMTGILWVGFISAFLLAMYPGFLFSVLRAIPFWHSVLLIPLFLAQAFGGGVAMTFLLAARTAPALSAAAVGLLVEVDLCLLFVTASLIGGHLLATYRAGPLGQTSVRQLLEGRFRALFGFGAVLAGLIVPAVLLALACANRRFDSLLPLAGLLQLTGILLFKYCLLDLGAYRSVYDERLLRAAHASGEDA